MTSYQGGKKRLGKEIHAKIIEIEKERLTKSTSSTRKMTYFEPFVGMCGVMKYFGQEEDRECFACDMNKDLILLWCKLQKGWKPPVDVSKEQYEGLKKTSKNSALRGFVGSACSYAGSFFSGYRGKYDKVNNYAEIGSRKLLELVPSIKNVTFLDSDSYDNFDPENMLIYCDPPYVGNNVPNKLFYGFDSARFWETMREWSKPSKKNIVIISERVAPQDFKKVWSKKYSVNFRKGGKNVKREMEECLFIYDSFER